MYIIMAFHSLQFASSICKIPQWQGQSCFPDFHCFAVRFVPDCRSSPIPRGNGLDFPVECGNQRWKNMILWKEPDSMQ